jgi:hypothetical protein
VIQEKNHILREETQMKIVEQVQGYYKGSLTFFDDVKEQDESLDRVMKKEQRLMDLHPFGDELSDSNDESDFAVLDDVNTLKNVVVFVEINRYRETFLSDMQEKERDIVIRLMIDNLNRFHVKPVAYEVKEDSIVVGWYLNSAINTFRFSECIEAIED